MSSSALVITLAIASSFDDPQQALPSGQYVTLDEMFDSGVAPWTDILETGFAVRLPGKDHKSVFEPAVRETLADTQTEKTTIWGDQGHGGYIRYTR